MATGQFFNPPLRHIGRATSSGTFVIPNSVSKVYVQVTGARGGQSQSSAQPGAALCAAGFVEVLPGSTAQIVIGAGGTNNVGPVQNGTAGGTTSFDGALTVTGSAAGNYDTRYGSVSTGATGVRSDASTLPTGSPAGAIVRVSSVSTSGPTDSANNSAGFINIYA
jgi:hypothetical protein